MNSTEQLLNDAADHIAATLEQPADNRAWAQLLIYCPKELIIQRTQALASLQCEDAVILATGLVPDEAAVRADEREKAIHDADQFVGALWSDLFNKDMVKAEGAYLFDKWRVQIRAAAIRSGGGQ